MCSYHLCVKCSSSCILSMFQECDITGGDIKECILSMFQECDITGGCIKEVNQYVGSVYTRNCLEFLFFFLT
jgi:hypothetical protein